MYFSCGLLVWIDFKYCQRATRFYLLKTFFQIYEGYLDDHDRQTDNAWLETVVYNFHDEENILYKFLLAVSTNYFTPCLILDQYLIINTNLYSNY